MHGTFICDESRSILSSKMSPQTKKAVDIATVKGKLDTECFIFPIRKDHETYERVKDLLQANGELKEVLNSGFDPADEKVY